MYYVVVCSYSSSLFWDLFWIFTKKMCALLPRPDTAHKI